MANIFKRNEAAKSQYLYLHEVIFFSVLIVGLNSAVAQQTPGSALYQSGKDATAILLQGKLKVPAVRFPCANCHGEDGMGGREGATKIPPIGWKSLSTPSIERPAYSSESFQNALRFGVAANGKKLGDQMPRYEADQQNLVSLIEYLKRLDVEQRAGIDAHTIQIDPPNNKDERLGFMEAIERFNKQGGSYGRIIKTEFKGQSFLSADEVAAKIDEQLGHAIQEQILDNVVADGVSVVSLSSGAPGAALTHKLDLMGLQYDQAAPTLLVLDRRPINFKKMDRWFDQTYRSNLSKARSGSPRNIYAPASAVGPLVTKFTGSVEKITIIDFDEDSVRWALSEQYSARAAAGFALGTLLGEAVLGSGRDPTRHAVVNSMEEIDLQARIFVWSYDE